MAQDIHQKGYYSENEQYSEEHIVRVAMFSNAIANMEGQDDRTKKLLGEAAKYYSSGRMIDSTEEQHQEYSAKIAGKELCEMYSKTDMGIVQAAIELQGISAELEEKKLNELCGKYGLSLEDGKTVTTIAHYISDAVNLDKARFVPKAKEPEEKREKEKLYFWNLRTDTAKRLIKSSYCMQDQLSIDHLKELEKIAHIDYEAEKSIIAEKFFTYEILGNILGNEEKEKAESPIVQEEYFKHKYREVARPVEVGMELGKKQEIEQIQTTVEVPVYTEQQIGRATINVPTISKDDAKDREQRDEQKLQQTREEQTVKQ